MSAIKEAELWLENYLDEPVRSGSPGRNEEPVRGYGVFTLSLRS